MVPKPYSDRSSIRTDSSNDTLSEVPIQTLPETPSPPTYSGTTTPSPTPQEQVLVESFVDPIVIQEINRAPDFGAATTCYPSPGDIMPYDHSLPDFIRQITNQSNLANLHSLSLRVISTLISLHRMSAYLPNLRYLDLEGSILNSLRDIGCSLKNLQILKVGRCQLESLDGTFGLSSLRELHAQKNFISDVSPCSNLPHIRHIDVSGNRIRNISYAGFLSVCNKLKSIVFTGNPATQVPDYRKHVRRILPQLETLDGVPFITEAEDSSTNIDVPDNADEDWELERCSAALENSSTSAEVPDFSAASPTESLNNLRDSEEYKRNKQVKNSVHQEQSDGCDIVQEVPTAMKFKIPLQRDCHRVHEEYSDQLKIIGIRNMSTKQKCASVQKIDKDNENRSKKTISALSEKFSEPFTLSSEISTCSILERNISFSTREEVLRNIPSKEEKSTRPFIATGSTSYHSNDRLEGRTYYGAVKKTMLPEIPTFKTTERLKDDDYGKPSQLTIGSPVCGNLAAALRSRKKILNAWDEKQNLRGLLGEEVQNERLLQENGIKKLEVQVNGSGDCSGTEFDYNGVDENDLIEEDVLVTSRKWREAFRRFRFDNRPNWEDDLETDSPNLLRETSDLAADEK